MSIFPAIIELLHREHAFKPITGDLVLIGKQSIEQSTQTDIELFASLCDARFHALDVSDYEGADIIHDLNQPLPQALVGCADFIFDGSCLDNIFDVGTAMRSLSRLLRPGGRIVLMEHGTAIQNALTTFSPEWFFNFFAANEYEDCQVYLGLFPFGMRKEWWLCLWEPFDQHDNPVPATPLCGDFFNLVIAEKGASSTDDRIPIQAQYRVMHHASVKPYVRAYHRYKGSERRQHFGNGAKWKVKKSL
jgi:SAM-dependent methyltransferase